MSAGLSGDFNVQEFSDAGILLVGGRLYTYAHGTTTQLTAYTDIAGTVPHTYTDDGMDGQYIALNARGELPAPLYLTTGYAYDLALKRSDGSTVWTRRADAVVSATDVLTVLNFGAADPVAPAYLKTISDMINGIEVSLFRFIPTTKHVGIYAGTDVSDLTTNVQDAFDGINTYKRGTLFAPAGTYNFNQVNAPSNLRLRGAGVATIFKPIGVFANNAMLYIGSKTDVEMGNFQILADRATYPNLIPIYGDTSSRLNIHHILMTKSGRMGVYTANCTDSDFEHLTIAEAQQRGIQHTGASSYRVNTRFCTVHDVYLDHCIQYVDGADHEMSDCITYNAPVFGANMYGTTRGKIINHRSYDTVREGINLQDANNCEIINPSVFWSASASTDFGISIWGESGSAKVANFNTVRGGYVMSCSKSGIALADACSYNVIDGVTIVNPNSLNEAQGSAVLLYGSNCQNNEVSNITAYASNGKMRYAVNEYNSGGSPSVNRFVDIKSTGHLTAPINKVVTSTEACAGSGYQAWTPTVTPTAGAITAYSIGVAKFYETEKMTYFYFRITITTNGTGSGAVSVTLPFTNGAVGAVIAGRESQNTGVALTGTIGASATAVLVRKYDNSYPAIDGSVLEMSGFFMRV